MLNCWIELDIPNLQPGNITFEDYSFYYTHSIQSSSSHCSFLLSFDAPALESCIRDAAYSDLYSVSFQHPFLLTTESLPAVLFQIPSPTQFSPSPTLFIDNVSANGSENGTDVLAICSDDAESHVRFIELLSHPRRRTPRPFEQMPKMQMKSVLKSSQMEMLSKKMSALPKYAKMNRSEVRRFHSPLISSCSEFRLRRWRCLWRLPPRLFWTWRKFFLQSFARRRTRRDPARLYGQRGWDCRGVRRRKGQ